MARWVQFGIVACVAFGLGVYLRSQSGRSLENLIEMEKGQEVSGSPSALWPAPVESPDPSPLGLEEDEISTDQPEKTDETPRAELEIQVAKQGVLALLSENKKFRKEVLDLEGQIRKLTHSLAEDKLENDRLRLKIGEIQDKRTEVSIPGPSIPEVCEVIDINKKLNLVVLNRGSADGIQHRMQLTVIREGSRIAQLEAVNVRSRITGAAITFLEENETVVAGDRVIPTRN